MTVALYLRVSTDEQAQQGFSIDNQRERLIAYCASQGWDDYRLYVDDGYTGTNMDRPALQRMIQHIQAGRIEMVVVYKLDRLGRKQKDVLYLLEDVFDVHGATFKSATEPFDTSTSFGKAMMGMLAVFAQLERDTIIERTTAGRRQRIQRGLWHGGRIPFGYTWDKSIQTLKIVPERAELVRTLYRQYLDGKSLSELSDWLTERTSVISPNHATVRDILKRPVYIGKLRLGKTVVPGRHEPIVDEGVWNKVQEERKRRRDNVTPDGSYLLSGLCKCGLCGSSIIHIPRRSRGYNYEYYCCKNQHVRSRERRGMPFCTLGYFKQDKLEKQVVEVVMKAAFNPNTVRDELERLNELDEGPALHESLESALKDVSSRLNRWYDAFEEGALSPQQLKDRIGDLEEEKKKFQFRLEELEEAVQPVKNDELFNMLEFIKDNWEDLDLGEQQYILRDSIERIVVLPDDLSIVWRA